MRQKCRLMRQKCRLMRQKCRFLRQHFVLDAKTLMRQHCRTYSNFNTWRKRRFKVAKKPEEIHALKNFRPEEKQVEDRYVAMSNGLARAAHGLNLAEKRLIMVAVSKLDSRKSVDSGNIVKTKITAQEYSEIATCELSVAYKALASAGRQLYGRSITFFAPHFKRNGKPAGDTINHMRWVGRVKYHKQEGWIELVWWNEVLPHLTGLKRQFTTYRLKQASALRSRYSWKMLELLKRFESTGWAEYPIEDFCLSMEATDKQKANFNNIRRRIIEPAIKELQEKEGWIISWEPIKRGRKVTSLRFDFKKDPQGCLF